MNRIILLTLFSLVSLFSAAQSEYKTLPSGLRYKILHDEPGAIVESGGVVYFNYYIYKTEPGHPDSLMEGPRSAVVRIADNYTEGTIEEVFLHMSTGDSTAILIRIQDFYADVAPADIPAIFSNCQDIKFIISVTQLLSKDEVAQMNQQKEAEEKARIAELIRKEEDYKQKYYAEDSIRAQLKRDDKRLKKYLIKNEIKNVYRSEHGVYYTMQIYGDGLQNQPGDLIRTKFRAMYMDGEIFNFNDIGYPFEFTLGTGEVILGWDEAIAVLRKGDKATLYIPAALAYGSNGQLPNIPPDSCLIFEVEILE